jgi:hypothetical protein
MASYCVASFSQNKDNASGNSKHLCSFIFQYVFLIPLNLCGFFTNRFLFCIGFINKKQKQS